jgi:hypothetical protein
MAGRKKEADTKDGDTEPITPDLFRFARTARRNEGRCNEREKGVQVAAKRKSVGRKGEHWRRTEVLDSGSGKGLDRR